jgi:hypothetical protein
MSYRNKLLGIVSSDCIEQHDKIIENLKYSGQPARVETDGLTMEVIHKATIMSLINTSIASLTMELDKIRGEL